MIEARTGRRYETCARCGVSWNVPLDLVLTEEGGYLCPGCRSWKRRMEPKEEDKNEK